MAIAVHVTADVSLLLIDKSDDRAVGRRVVVSVKVGIAGFAAGIVGRSVNHQLAVHLDFLSGQGRLILAVFQRLDKT